MKLSNISMEKWYSKFDYKTKHKRVVHHFYKSIPLCKHTHAWALFFICTCVIKCNLFYLFRILSPWKKTDLAGVNRWKILRLLICIKLFDTVIAKKKTNCSVWTIIIITQCLLKHSINKCHHMRITAMSYGVLMKITCL